MRYSGSGQLSNATITPITGETGMHRRFIIRLSYTQKMYKYIHVRACSNCYYNANYHVYVVHTASLVFRTMQANKFFRINCNTYVCIMFCLLMSLFCLFD